MRKILNDLASRSTQHSWFAIRIFFVLLLVSPFIGYWIYGRQMDTQESQTRQLLTRIAENRSATISAFIYERSADARLISEGSLLREALNSWERQGHKDDRTKAQIRQSLDLLRKIYAYIKIAILDGHGNILVSTEDAIYPIESITAEVVGRAVRSNELQISTIHSPTKSVEAPRFIDIAAPIALEDARGEEVTAVLLLRFDPERQIYPSLQVAPFSTLANDALLVEVRGQKVIALSDSRYGLYRYGDTLPISPRQLIESATTATGSLIWQAGDGNQEIGAVRAIRGAPWFVVTMIAEDVVRGIVRNTALIAAGGSAITLCILGFGLLLWWKYKESEFKLATLKADTEKRLLRKQYDYLSKYANDMIILTDAEYRILEVNDKALQMLGYPGLDLIGQPIAILAASADRERLQDNLSGLRHEGTAIFEVLQRRHNGTVFPTEVSARLIDFEGKSFGQFICRDISERKAAERKIQSLAYYDSVTMLPNRTLLNDRLEQAIHMAIRSDKKIGVLFMDLDNFKNINDSLGHQIGDMLLYLVGRRLLGCVREEDTVARIGGDEFMILLPDLDKGEEARLVAEKAIAALTKPFLLQTHQIYTTASIGISLFPDDAKELADLVKYADSALYEAKSGGRNNYQFFTKKLNERIIRASRIESRLRHAMDMKTGELCLWYQPQIDIRSGKVIGAEALLRWQGLSTEYFEPTDFITVAEERGLITRLGEWTIREACKQCRTWQAKGLRAIPVAVNVSTIQLQQKEFADMVLDILRESDLDASYLDLEITETSIMQKAQVVSDLAMRLRDSGVRISIDDFGTGYSSLSYLKHLPIDKIKIDQSFVFDMLRDADDEAITQTIVKLGQSMQLRVIAEGVESQEQMERLLSLGCHEAQGYFYSRAVSPEMFQNFLTEEWSFKVAAEAGAA